MAQPVTPERDRHGPAADDPGSVPDRSRGEDREEEKGGPDPRGPREGERRIRDLPEKRDLEPEQVEPRRQ